ncbi:MAG: M48 family metallopeptidase [Clostridiales bacterium]|nr:M48 family metallopeptidase [Clostridiales bacterium]
MKRQLAMDTILPGTEGRFPELDNAIVHFDVMSQSRRLSARWRGDKLHVVVPVGYPLKKALMQLLEMKDRILAMRPGMLYSEGQVMEFDGFSVTLSRQNLKPRVITLTGDTLKPVISLGTALSYDAPGVHGLISKLMLVVAKKVSPLILLPRARELAEKHGLRPRRWKISSGHRVLGHCSSEGEIAISSIVVFLPPRLRDYIINHELAHLTHMNHSAAFHALCNQYCKGDEKLLIKELKTFKWPVLK